MPRKTLIDGAIEELIVEEFDCVMRGDHILRRRYKLFLRALRKAKKDEDRLRFFASDKMPDGCSWDDSLSGWRKMVDRAMREEK